MTLDEGIQCSEIKAAVVKIAVFESTLLEHKDQVKELRQDFNGLSVKFNDVILAMARMQQTLEALSSKVEVSFDCGTVRMEKIEEESKRQGETLKTHEKDLDAAKTRVRLLGIIGTGLIAGVALLGDLLDIIRG